MKRKIGILALLLVLAAGGYAFGIYHGIFFFNNPSKAAWPVRGIDVAHYQGEIDWAVLGAEEIDFAYIKATEGSSHTDIRFADNWRDARTTGLMVGAYHFFSFDSPGSTQAEHFIAVLGDDVTGMLTPVADVEFYGDKQQNPPAADAVEAELRVFLEQLEREYGVRPMIYATMESWELYIKNRFDEYPLWIREVVKTPVLENGYDWVLWQYTNRGRLSGYDGEEKYIDLNVFHGSREAWELFVQNHRVGERGEDNHGGVQ